MFNVVATLLFFFLSTPDSHAVAVSNQCVDASLTAVEHELSAFNTTDPNLFVVELWRSAGSDPTIKNRAEQQVTEVIKLFFFYIAELLRRSSGDLEEQAVAIRRMVVSMGDACVGGELFCKTFKTQSFDVARLDYTKTVFLRPSDKILSAKVIAQRLFSVSYLSRSEDRLTEAQRIVEQSVIVKQSTTEGLVRHVGEIGKGAISDAKASIAAFKLAHETDPQDRLALSLAGMLREHFSLSLAAATRLEKVLATKEPKALNTIIDLWLSRLVDVRAVEDFQRKMARQFDRLRKTKTSSRSGVMRTLILPIALRDEGLGLTDYINDDLSSYTGVKKIWKSNMLMGFVTFFEADNESHATAYLTRNAYVRWSFVEALKEVENKNI